MVFYIHSRDWGQSEEKLPIHDTYKEGIANKGDNGKGEGASCQEYLEVYSTRTIL